MAASVEVDPDALDGGLEAPTPKDAQRSEELKSSANQAFQAGKFAQAVALYGQALACNETAILYANRAFAHTRMEAYGLAILDAEKAIALDPNYTKGYYRRGCALLQMGKAKEAQKDFKILVQLEPQSSDARKKLQEVQKLVQAERFAEAFRDDRTVTSASSSGANVDPASIVVEPSYSGPHLDADGTVTREFVLAMMELQKGQRNIHKKYAYMIIYKAMEAYRSLPTLVDLKVPESDKFTVCGDIHGQYYDLCNIFELNGCPSSENPYLFNGDFVDRGSFSVEVILTLFAWKAHDPLCMFQTRGNHETKNMNKIYGFEGEVKSKYEQNMYEVFCQCFNQLPLCAVLNEKVMIVHGGLFSKDGVKLDDIRKIDRYREPPDEGLMTELLWSDPQPAKGRSPSKRGVGVAFGPDVTKRFLDDNGLELLVRSHECKDEGFEIEADGRLITVFSAPNYCDQIGNKGAFINFGADCKPQIRSYSAVPHPAVRPMAYAGGFGSLFGMM